MSVALMEINSKCRNVEKSGKNILYKNLKNGGYKRVTCKYQLVG